VPDRASGVDGFGIRPPRRSGIETESRITGSLGTGSFGMEPETAPEVKNAQMQASGAVGGATDAFPARSRCPATAQVISLQRIADTWAANGAGMTTKASPTGCVSSHQAVMLLAMSSGCFAQVTVVGCSLRGLD
jgi:hypothetical protein